MNRRNIIRLAGGSAPGFPILARADQVIE